MTGHDSQRTPAPRHHTAGSIGLALAGGGPLGGTYEVGTLLALADSIEHLDCNALDVYVGVSSGSFVAAALANGPPAQMYRLFITVQKLARGGLPLVLSQTFRAIIHSRMKVGMDKYATQYPHADVLLFEPAREDVDMFFARIFSYAQRRRLCALAFESTRSYLRRNAESLAPRLSRHGLGLRTDRVNDPKRDVTDALDDPRPLHAGTVRRRTVRTTARDLEHTLTHLERQLSLMRAAR